MALTMAAPPVLTDELLAELRERADPVEYERLLRGFRWDKGRLRPGRSVKVGKASPQAFVRVLRLVSEAPGGVTGALREAAPREVALAGLPELDLAWLDVHEQLRSLYLSDIGTVRGLRRLAGRPGLVSIELAIVRAVDPGDELSSPSLRSLRAPELHRELQPGLPLLPLLGRVPQLESLMTRAARDDSLARLAEAAPALTDLTLLREQPADLRPLRRLALRHLSLMTVDADLSTLPLLSALRTLSITTRPPNASWDLARPIDLVLGDDQAPGVERLQVNGPVRRLGALPGKLERLTFELAQRFALEGDAVVRSVRELSLESRAGTHDLALLRRFPELRTLSLSGPGWSSLDALEACPKLEHLSLHQLTRATDVRFLHVPRRFELAGGARLRESLGLPPAS